MEDAVLVCRHNAEEQEQQDTPLGAGDPAAHLSLTPQSSGGQWSSDHQPKQTLYKLCR